MKRFVEGVDHGPGGLFPERLDEWIGEDNAVRVIDAFVDELDLGSLGFGRVEPEASRRLFVQEPVRRGDDEAMTR